MKKLIFDTNVIDLLIRESLPIKWKKYWHEIQNKTKQLLLFEILITEIFYKLSKKYGYKTIQTKILQLKSLQSLILIKIDDNLAISAGKFKNRYQKHNLSIVDSYILACSKKYNARIISTDPGIKKACKDEKVEIDFIPFKEVS